MKTNFCVFMLLALLASVASPFTLADSKRSGLVQENPGLSIYEKFKDAIVEIDVRIELKNGKVKHRGGSGYFTDKNGHVKTAAHVVKLKLKPDVTTKELESVRKTTYFVILTSKNRKYRAKLIGSNDYADVALLQVMNIDPNDYTAVVSGDPDKLKVGEKVWAIGNPRSLANSLTGGTVSYLHRHIGLSYIEDFIQTDCPINFGNSGCPVFNAKEEVIGITQAIIIESDGLAFITSINLAKFELLNKGEVELPSLGFEAMIDNFPRDGKSSSSPGFEDLQTLKAKTEIEEIENLTALANGTYTDNFAIVTSIDEFEDPDAEEKKPGTAKKAGLEKGDLIISLDGKLVRSGMDIRIFLMDKSAGDIINVVYKRAMNGVMILKSTDVTLTKRVLASGEDE